MRGMFIVALALLAIVAACNGDGQITLVVVPATSTPTLTLIPAPSEDPTAKPTRIIVPNQTAAANYCTFDTRSPCQRQLHAETVREQGLRVRCQ